MISREYLKKVSLQDLEYCLRIGFGLNSDEEGNSI